MIENLPKYLRLQDAGWPIGQIASAILNDDAAARQRGGRSAQTAAVSERADKYAGELALLRKGWSPQGRDADGRG